MSGKKLSLSEAALEIFAQNRKKADAQQDKFGQGEKLTQTTDTGTKEVGNANLDAYDMSDVPSAVAPGKTGLGQEPMKKLPDTGVATTVDKSTKNIPSKKGINEEDDEEDEDEDDVVVNEDIEALMSGENLSAEFKQKATAIFEAAVKAKVSELATELEEQYVAQFEEAYEEMKEDFADKVNSYLDYVTESWMTENKLAVENGLKTELVTSFIDSLKQVFVEHYIDIPEDQVNVVEELASKVEALETQIDEEMQKNINLKKQLSEQKKLEAVNTVCEGLTLSQQEKIKSIAEGVDFNSEDEFVSQLENIKESYFSKETVKPAAITSLDDQVVITEEDTKEKVMDPMIAAYVKRISQTSFK